MLYYLFIQSILLYFNLYTNLLFISKYQKKFFTQILLIVYTNIIFIILIHTMLTDFVYILDSIWTDINDILLTL